MFYASQLQPIPELARQELHGTPPADGTGLRWHPVEHEGNAIESIEEADVIVALVRDLLAISPTWTTRAGDVKPVTLEEIVIVAPYNAHVELIGERLAAAGFAGARVGTVDKFQGQEAAVSIYAMGSSSAEEAPRGMEFLYSLNRLNVATSRARCAAIVVASPGAHPGLVPQPAPDAARERAVPAGRGGPTSTWRGQRSSSEPAPGRPRPTPSSSAGSRRRRDDFLNLTR